MTTTLPDPALTQSCASMVAVLRRRAEASGASPVYTYLRDGEEDALSYTFAQLDARARAIGATLQRAGARGERVLLPLPGGLDYLAGFFGCLYAGATAVSVFPPRRGRMFTRLGAIMGDCSPRFALINNDITEAAEQLLDDEHRLPQGGLVNIDGIDLACGDAWRDPGSERDDLAFLQYTSGSTDHPRGVQVSHGNLLHNSDMMRRAFRLTPDRLITGWLPLFHDMGLIGMALQAVMSGAHCVYMAPELFLVKPARWLRAVSRYRATNSGAPNFAYDHCVKRVKDKDLEGVDLSSWRVAFNAAEPVVAATLDRFAERFAPYGFRREAFHPCYGLAESTLLVTVVEREEEPTVVHFRGRAMQEGVAEPCAANEAGAVAYVGCGDAWGLDVRIVDPHTKQTCEAAHVGEIWVAGESVARGYWGHKGSAGEVFGASIADDTESTHDGAWLRTGDLGFFHAGHLFVVGRIKDLIIVAGRNHIPSDIERTVIEADEIGEGGSAAAFMADDPAGGAIVVVAEVGRRALPRLLASGHEALEARASAAIRKAVSQEHDVRVKEVVFLSPHSIPKTTSGKVQRYRCRELYQTHALQTLASRRP